MCKKSMTQILKRAKPFFGAIFIQFGYAGVSIISKFALNKGMSQHVYIVYRNAAAAAVIAPFAFFFDRNVRPKMTLPIFAKIMLMALLEPVIDQNLYFSGIKLTTATFATALCNVLPAFAFAMAWILRLEKVKITSVHTLAKILGTIVTIGGATFMTFVKGPILNLPWEKENDYHQKSTNLADHILHDKQDTIKGALMIIVGCVCWSAFMILQAITLKSYPVELSQSFFICLTGAIQSSVVAIAFEWDNPSAWAIHFDSMLLSVLYSGIVCSGINYYIQGFVMKERGPVFVTAFNPLSMVIVAILGSFLLSEMAYLGSVIGAIIIVIGLYMVLWGKSKDYIDLRSESESIDNNKLTRIDEETRTKTTQNQESIDEEMRTKNTKNRESMIMDSRKQVEFV